MKNLFCILILLSILGGLNAQESTCKSRCEETGIGVDQCKEICKNFRENSSKPIRKKDEVTTASQPAATTTQEVPIQRDIKPLNSGESSASATSSTASKKTDGK